MEEGGKIRIVLADDHPIVCEGLVAVLSSEPDMTIVGQASDGNEALEMIRSLRPDVAILDLQMPRRTGLEVIRSTREFDTQVRLAIISINRDHKIIAEALETGVSAYLFKNGSPREWAQAIRAMMRGETYLSPEILN